MVTKRFRSWARDEPAREWGALRLLAESAPGLAARPISASLNGEPPEIRMSWLPGEPLGMGPVSEEQAQALARSLDLLWRSVPPGRLAGLPARESIQEAFTGQVRHSLAAGHYLGSDPEDSGASERAFELATLVEHLSAWPDARLDAGAFVALFELSAAERARLAQFRRLAALFWLLLLRPGGRASRRNPPGTLRRQAERLLALLG